MGKVWKVEMVLMSTLAALVILAHSAEEDLANDRSYDIQPRILDTGPANSDQIWRAIEEPSGEPSETQPWDDPPDDNGPKRRRTLRKRKRRPTAQPNEPIDRDSLPEDRPRANTEIDTPQTEPPRKRRRKPEKRRHRISEENTEVRPLRRKTKKRKRPSLDSWPVLSEFNQYRSDEVEVTAHTANTKATDEDDEKTIDDWPQAITEKIDDTQEYKTATKPAQEIKTHDNSTLDKSLSEFSVEYQNPVVDDKMTRLDEKAKDKINVKLVLNKKKNGPIDPLTLKQILKKSNGTSLSEILQEHNLTLADLLHGRQDAISVLKSDSATPTAKPSNLENVNIEISEAPTSEEKNKIESTESETNAPPVEYLQAGNDMRTQPEKETENDQETLIPKENAPKLPQKRTFTGTLRRKPMRRKTIRLTNSTRKGVLSRDLIAQNALRYSDSNGRNSTKTSVKKDTIRIMINPSESSEGSKKEDQEIMTTTLPTDDPTTVQKYEENEETVEPFEPEDVGDDQIEPSATKELEDDQPEIQDDFITTDLPEIVNMGSVDKDSYTTMGSKVTSTTEETAKIEIEEILNDTRTSARLSKILMERNMTLNELVEHRERGSSHLHLADIFHNASREPNPPEPFLSKSLIEPISRETYPLKALLEANLHDSAKVTTMEPNQAQVANANIPVVMDFGNNVNENGENMGIMSLFNKITNNDNGLEGTSVRRDSDGMPYITTIMNVNSTENNRESRIIKDRNNQPKPDVMSWNDLFALMRKGEQNNTQAALTEQGLLETVKSKVLEDDKDGDGLIVLEDLQHLKDFDSHIASASDEKLEVNSYDNAESHRESGILDHLPNNTRSVTVATASIVGLTMILFLLTYATFKWRQQRKMLKKKQSFSNERIPSPVFENRKSHKNCSTRSISPMLSSNIYTLNTLESRNGKESPDYAWDSLRKPFQ